MTIVVFTLLGTIAVAQEPGGTVMTSDLVHWSYMQQPQQPEEKQPGQTPTSAATAETHPALSPTAMSADHAMEPQNSGMTTASQKQTFVESNALAPQQEEVTALQIADH